eukprot:PLAT519.1.p1 GENE.PLAT519.1~~PLAT519.1.p1  ORF type:complete len:317 (-),score=115.95 PLAT519.1:83-1033(-)
MGDLTEALLEEGLSQVERTLDGDGYAFVRLTLTGKAISSLTALAEYPHLCYIDVAHNEIEDISALAGLESLLSLSVAHNKLGHMPRLPQPFLQIVNLEGNEISHVGGDGVGAEAVTFLNVSECGVESVADFGSWPSLEVLDLHGNQLATVEGLGELEALMELDLRDNQLIQLSGLSGCAALELLNLAGNKLQSTEELAALPLDALCELDLSHNALPSAAACAPLARLSALSVLVVTGNPFTADVDSFRVEVLSYLPTLSVIDDDDVTSDERKAAKAMVLERQAAAEAAAAAAAAAAAEDADGEDAGEGEGGEEVEA